MADSLFTMPFGKFKGQDIEDIETDYLEWIVGEQWFKEKFKDGRKAIEQELEYREKFGDK
jgi:uncharacterized protein (DUF3820 family)